MSWVGRRFRSVMKIHAKIGSNTKFYSESLMHKYWLFLRQQYTKENSMRLNMRSKNASFFSIISKISAVIQWYRILYLPSVAKLMVVGLGSSNQFAILEPFLSMQWGQVGLWLLLCQTVVNFQGGCEWLSGTLIVHGVTSSQIFCLA